MSTESDDAPEPTGRREFLDYLIGLSGAGGGLVALAAIISYLRPPEAAGASSSEGGAVGDASDFPVGEGKVVSVGGKPVIVIHTKDRLVALSAICTHLGCIVAWHPERKQIVCPCHAGVFDLNGNVVSGPPPKPLKAYRAQEVEGKIVVREA